MAEKKDVSLLLLGIVAILAIVGLVLLFTSPAATGNAYFPPELGPEVQYAAGPVIANNPEQTLPRCPNGFARSRQQQNLPYEVVSGHYCNWYYCAGLENSIDPIAKPIMACSPIPQ
ncbi:hypothetical protein COV18_06805 [Candidatus Woesearchaeota archaeon CG10_big_fil_rev_8_21_14_0_10_37_12]|nr:MAG: hypothetical protein COV18_06805 [Candidatus Woesearchaeota archaeon CG10_big_fil_rev_8_21_14_0_10_37_12]